MNRLPCAALVALSIFGIASLHSQTQPNQTVPQKKKPANDIFSGSITELAPDSVTVVRKVPAREAVIRKFILDAQTKVEGSLKVKSRVSVQYQADDDGQFHALHIIVR